MSPQEIGICAIAIGAIVFVYKASAEGMREEAANGEETLADVFWPTEDQNPYKCRKYTNGWVSRQDFDAYDVIWIGDNPFEQYTWAYYKKGRIPRKYRHLQLSRESFEKREEHEIRLMEAWNRGRGR